MSAKDHDLMAAPASGKLLRDFESKLDAAFEALPSRQWSSTGSLRLASELYEIAAFANGVDSAEWVERAISILAGHFAAGQAGYEPRITEETDIRQMMDDLVFAGHYYMIREYLYYSYNVPGSMSWSFADQRVEIRFSDKTIPRQFFTVHNDQVLDSTYHFRDFHHSDEIVRLLKNEPECVSTPNLETADPLMTEEVDLKLAAYFSLIASDSAINLGGYSYEQFLKIYRMLLKKALYHRYFARAQDAVGAIYMLESDLLDGIQKDLSIAPEIASLVLKDLVYDRDATTKRVDATYFSLIREGEPNGRIVMRPHHFAIAEGLVNLLRVIAQRHPKTFLDQVSNEIGSAFVRRVKAAWEAEGFICHSEVSLRDYDPSLPDVDLLVISIEPTLGYVIFACELKSPVPPRWAKDQLKVLNKDSVSKAFRQVEALQAFIRTEDGIRWLVSMLPKEGHPRFDSFIVAVDPLIITSDNAGMFFGDESTRVINFRTLERLLRRSDGDMALIQHVLRTYAEHADMALETVMIEFQLGDTTIAYEGVGPSRLLEFPHGYWRSDPELPVMVNAFVADGLHPFDTLEHRPPDLMVVDHSRKPRGKDRAPDES